MVFKLERERPAATVYQNSLFYITKDKHVRSYDFTTQVESASLLSLRKLGSTFVPPRTLSYNPAVSRSLSLSLSPITFSGIARFFAPFQFQSARLRTRMNFHRHQ